MILPGNPLTRLAALGTLLAATFTPIADAAQSSAGSGEIAIYREATGTDTIGPNANPTSGFLIHDFDTNDREDAGSFSRTGADITLNRAGHYLAIYNSRFDATVETNAEQRVEIQSYLTINGNELASGWSQGFIRRQQNQRETITSGMAIFEASASDVLNLRSFRTDTTTVGTVTRFPNATGLQLIKLDDVNMSFARVSRAANQTGPIDATFVKVAFDTDDEVGDGFSHAAGDLTIADAGKYLVIANSYIQGANNRTALVQRLNLDGTPVPNSTTTVYTRGNNQSTQDGAAAIGMILETTAPNQVLSVEGSLDVNNAVSYVGGRCALTVIKLPSAAAGTSPADPDYIRIRHTAAQNINTAADTALIFNTQDELDPAFSHTTATSDVTVNVDGDYLFLSSVFDATDDVARGFYAQGWSVNASAKSPLGQSGRYSRSTGGADQFGNTSGFVGSGLTSGNTVAMVSSALGNGGVNNANAIALQGVRLESLFTTAAGFEVIVAPLAVSVAEGGAVATYDISLGLAPTSGTVEITVTSDADTEVSLNGVDFFATVTPSFSSGGAPQTITVRAFDDGLIEGPEPPATITHAITTTSDPVNYPTTLPIASVSATVTDDDVVAVDAVDDSSVTNANEDTPATEALIGGSVLANDTDGLNNFVSSADSVSAMGAAVNVATDGTFTYDPTGAAMLQMIPAGGSAIDTFTYTAEDVEGNSDTATVSITVDGENDGPEALPDVLNDGPLENGTFTNAVDITANDGSYRNNPVPLTFPAGSDLRTLPGIVTAQSPTTANPPGGGVPGNALDGNFGNFTHTTPNNTVDHTWEIDFGQDVMLENISIFNRTNCCAIRLRDITVTVLDAGGSTVYTSPVLNPNNVLGYPDAAANPAPLFDDFGGGTVTGRRLVITRTPDAGDPDASDGSVLSLGEVTIIGSAPGSYPIDELLLNYDAAQSAGSGRWENLGSNAGSGMDWILTDVDLVTGVVSARNGISAAYEWDNAADRALLSGPGGDSVHDIMPGDPDTQNATWEFWLKPANNTSVMTVFETGGGAGFGIVFDNGVVQAATELDGAPATQSGSFVSYDLVADSEGLVGNDPTTEFNQYAVTLTVGGGLELYVNGVKVDDSGGAGVSGDWDGGDGSGLGRFGASNHGGFTNSAATATHNGVPGYYDATYMGQMAHVRLYSGVLPAARILQNFKAVDAGTDIDGDSIDVVGVLDGSESFVPNGSQATLASGALLTINDASGGFDYDPNGAFDLFPGQTATDTFTYRVSDPGGLTAESTVTLTITGVASPVDDNLVVNEGETAILTPNQLVKNDEIAATPGAHVELSPPTLSGGTWTNTGSAGASRNGTVVGSVVAAPDLASGFQTIGCASTGTNLGTLDAISTGDATIEIWFRPEPGQTGKSTVFETGGNGNGFSIVFDADTNEVTANVDGGDDATANIIATAGGISTGEFNQVIVLIDINGGNEVAPPSGIFEDLMSVIVNNDPLSPFDPTVDASGINAQGIANDWAGTDNGGLHATQGTTALNENFPGTVGEVAFFRAYPSLLSNAEMEVNFDAAIQALTAVSSPTTDQGATVTLNGDGTVSIDYTGVSLAPGAMLPDSFTYTTAGGTATVNLTIDAFTIQEDWRILYYGNPDNSGPGEDSAMAANGLTNLQSFAFDLDPTAPAGVLDVDTGAGTILSLGPPTIWTDPANGRIYLRHTRRTDFASIPLTITDQFSRNPGLPFEDSAVAPQVIATGTGDSGVAIEAVETEFPFVLPISGGKGRYGRVDVTTP